eukprot:15035751-Alexandrium_andersonii.AAC.1
MMGHAQPCLLLRGSQPEDPGLQGISRFLRARPALAMACLQRKGCAGAGRAAGPVSGPVP